MKYLSASIMLCMLSLVVFLAVADGQGKGKQTLLRHSVVITFKKGAPQSIIDSVDHSFANLSKLKMVKGFEWGMVTDESEKLQVKHIYITSFINKDDEAAYGKSPQHQAHIKLGAIYVESVQGVDYYTR